MDYPDDESSGIHSLDNLVSSWMKKHKTTTVVLPDAVEMQLDESLHSIESAEESVATPAPPLEASGSVQQSSVQVRDSTVSLEDEEQEEPKKPRRNGRRPYIMGGILLVLVCIAAIVVVSMMAPDKSTPSATVSNNIKDGNEQDNHGDVNTPTGAVLTREESLTKIAQGVSSQEALDTPDSPQARALEWLIEHDAAKVTPSAGRSEDEQVQERYILAVFYYATGGVDWFDSFYFLSQNHVCNWKNLDFGMGVQCEDGSPTVTGLKFGPNNLQGTLPDEIFRLSGMKSFQVIMNPGLTGSIPSSISTQENLQVLNVNKNSLGGAIPDSLLSLPSLTTLWMDENSFEGTIPTLEEGDTTLQWWSCNDCGLTGRMPDSLRMPTF
jgi:hypothetical protein